MNTEYTDINATSTLDSHKIKIIEQVFYSI